MLRSFWERCLFYSLDTTTNHDLKLELWIELTFTKYTLTQKLYNHVNASNHVCFRFLNHHRYRSTQLISISDPTSDIYFPPPPTKKTWMTTHMKINTTFYYSKDYKYRRFIAGSTLINSKKKKLIFLEIITWCCWFFFEWIFLEIIT